MVDRDHRGKPVYKVDFRFLKLADEAFGNFTISELNNYWSECWGTPAEEALEFPEEPGVYISIGRSFFKYVGRASWR